MTGLFCIFVFCIQLSSAKIKTHLWIGQSIINELNQIDSLSIKGNKYQVDPDLRATILSNKKAFLAGCIGPDIIPDLVVGQMTIHPGIKNGWHTREWLNYILKENQGNPESQACAYGYFCHAATDVIFHTYANTFAGDVFILADEQEVELRHLSVEDYIERSLPSLEGFDDCTQMFSFPKAFLANTLIKSQEVQKEYLHLEAVAPHLVTMATIRNLVNELNSELNKIESGFSNQLADVTNKLTTARDEYIIASAPVHRLEAEITKYEGIINTYNMSVELQKKTIRDTEAIISNSISEIEKLSKKINEAEGKLSELRSSIKTALDKLNEIPQDIYETVTTEVASTVKKYVPGSDKVVDTVTETIKKTNPKWTTQNNLVDEYKKKLSTTENELNKFKEDKGVQEGLEFTNKAAKTAAELTLGTLALQQAAIHETQVVLDGLKEKLKPLKEKEAEIIKKVMEISDIISGLAFLKENDLKPLTTLSGMWVSNIDKAIEEYISASEEAARLLLSRSNPISAYTHWSSCWGPVFMGIPKEIPNTICFAKDEISDLVEKVSKFRKDIRDKIGDAAWIIDPMGKLQDFVEQKLVPQIIQASLNFVGQVIGQRAKQACELLIFEPSNETIVEIFTGPTIKNLIEIPDIISRLDNDMKKTVDGCFDRNLFYAIKNSIILSKIVLLPEISINSIIKDFNLGNRLLSKKYKGIDILLVGLLSIDGNHQWRQPTPPYIRKYGFSDPDYNLPYADQSSNNPLSDLFPEERKNQKALFEGPLVPSIEIPIESQLSDLRPAIYPYRPSIDNPYPIYGIKKIKSTEEQKITELLNRDKYNQDMIIVQKKSLLYPINSISVDMSKLAYINNRIIKCEPNEGVHIEPDGRSQWKVEFENPGIYSIKSVGKKFDGIEEEYTKHIRFEKQKIFPIKINKESIYSGDSFQIVFEQEAKTIKVFELKDERGVVIPNKKEKKLMNFRRYSSLGPGKYYIYIVSENEFNELSAFELEMEIKEPPLKPVLLSTEVGFMLARGCYSGYEYQRLGVGFWLAPKILAFEGSVGGAITLTGMPFHNFYMVDFRFLLNIDSLYTSAGIGYNGNVRKSESKNGADWVSAFNLSFGVGWHISMRKNISIFSEISFPLVKNLPIEENHTIKFGLRATF